MKLGAGEANRTPDPNLGKATGSAEIQRFQAFSGRFVRIVHEQAPNNLRTGENISRSIFCCRFAPSQESKWLWMIQLRPRLARCC